MVLRVAFLLFFTIPSAFSVAQNLVPNPGFEQFKSDTNCLVVQSKEEFAGMMEDWTMPTDGTADILSNNYRVTCRMHPHPDDQFSIGSQIPHSGDLMVGIFTYSSRSSREYIQVKLLQPLEKGQQYIAGMYVSLADSMPIAVNNIGMYFSDEKIDLDTLGMINAAPSVNSEAIIIEQNKWVLISHTFRAPSNATHLLIGNFYENSATKTQQVGDTTTGLFGPRLSSYYFIDDVFVEPLPELALPSVFTPNSDSHNETLFISELNPESWSLVVYNRWGKEVYFSAPYYNNWDGGGLSAGVYFYKLKHLRFPFSYQGRVSILRSLYF